MHNSLKTFINLVMNENLVQAQSLIKEKLNEALANALNEKYEAFAPTIFEDKGAKPDFLDLDNDGDTEEPMKQAARQAEGEDEDEAEDEEQSEEEEEGGSEEEEDEEDDQDSEENDEDSEEEKD